MPAAAEASALLGSLAAHWTPRHALVNAAGIAGLAGLIAWRESPKTVGAILALALALQALALLALPRDIEYRGASGFTYALAAYALARCGGREGAVLAAIAVACAVAAAAGGLASPLLPDGVTVAWQVHLAGAAAGFIVANSGRSVRSNRLTSPKGHTMGFFSKILDKLRHHAPDPTAGGPGAAPTSPIGAGGGGSVAPSGGATATAPAPSIQNVDIEAVLKGLAAKKGGGGNYKESIVDLLKLLDLDSSLDARKELAAELGVNAGPHGSAEQNIALHKAVMRKVAENGGKVPAFMKD